MDKIDAQRPMSLMREHVRQSKRRTNLERVESVMTRIFSKQRRYKAQACFRSLEPEDASDQYES